MKRLVRKALWYFGAAVVLLVIVGVGIIPALSYSVICIETGALRCKFCHSARDYKTICFYGICVYSHVDSARETWGSKRYHEFVSLPHEHQWLLSSRSTEHRGWFRIGERGTGVWCLETFKARYAIDVAASLGDAPKEFRVAVYHRILTCGADDMNEVVNLYGKWRDRADPAEAYQIWEEWLGAIGVPEE